jgi:hypothetical protein
LTLLHRLQSLLSLRCFLLRFLDLADHGVGVLAETEQRDVAYVLHALLTHR